MIGVLDYGLGNCGSILNMLRRIEVPGMPVRTEEDIQQVDRLILPGVGAFDRGMEQLDQSGLRHPLDVFSQTGKPVLGICLGMQLMTRRSDEGEREGLGWIDAETTAFAADPACAGMTIPHMGWDPVRVLEPGSLFDETAVDHRFYFVHSYRITSVRSGSPLATCRYGSDFVAAFRHGMLFGVQFHPEKSHLFGMRLLARFAQV